MNTKETTMFQRSNYLNVLFIALTFLLNYTKTYAQEHGPAWTRHTIDDSFQGADGVRLADVNGDGLMDITTGWEEGSRIRVYLNPGPSESKDPWPAVTVGQVGSPEDAVFVDLDSDGAIDVVSGCEGDVRTMYVHWAPKDKTKYLDPTAWETEAIPVTERKKYWMFCIPVQVDEKYGIDLVVGTKESRARIGWLESPENPRDLDGWQWHEMYYAGWIMSLAPMDMDGDGDLDIVASDRKGIKRGCLWLENPGPGAAQTELWNEHRIGGDGKEVMFFDLVDLDQDGLLDILVATRGKELIYLRRATSDSITWETFPIEIPPNTGTAKAVKVADIDLDGKLDIVFSCENAERNSGVMWMSYDRAVTDPLWNGHEISGPEGIKYDLIELLDLDADGDPDVITCEERDNLGVIWYENPTRIHPLGITWYEHLK